ncbi:MAG: outer membrane protein assembly factor BamC [Chromatiaceae bacterium]|nr:outer membrane protein assembly factor BamC [Chromatiaceae bacterium]
MMNKLSRNLVLAWFAVALAACSSVDNVLPDKSVEYKRERQAERNLEVPPDLTSDRINDRMSVPDNIGGVSTSYSDYLTDRKMRGADEGARAVSEGGVLPQIQNIEVKRDGDERWLVVGAPVDGVWQRVVDFWQENGILMQEQDPAVGIMRTAWLENRADIANDWLTDSIRKVFEGAYDAGTRDQYRLRFERTDDNRTEIYLTHFGMEEQPVEGTSGTTDRTMWVPRARDPGLEAEMLRRLMVYLGAADERARSQLAATGERERARSQLFSTSDGTQLMIADDFGRAWRLVGLALDRVGFAVEDRDRSAGIYYVRYHDPAQEDAEKGWLSKLAFWSEDKNIDKVNRYQVRVAAKAQQTVVSVADEQGVADSSPTAIRILTLLQEQIR